MQRSASTLKVAGNSFDEAIALTTAGNAIIQDPDKVGNALRTIGLRITGTASSAKELEKMGEDTTDAVHTASKLQEQIKKLTAVPSNGNKGVDILDSNGNYKSTYQILLDISKVYKEIQETDKKMGENRSQGLVEALAGKNRASVAASILENGDMLESVYRDSLNSDGSAQNELDKYLESIDGKIQQFQNSWQNLQTSFMNSDFLKGVIDTGTKFIDILDAIIDKIGMLGTIGAGAGIFGLFKSKTFNFDQPNPGYNSFREWVYYRSAS